jgi:hypothetical protein
MPDPDAAAHMSLHLLQQCQRAQKTDASSYPLLEGDLGAWFLVTVEADRLARRSGEQPYMWGVSAGQRLFAILCQFSRQLTANRGLPGR